MEKITVKDFLEGRAGDRPVYLPTHTGVYRVSHIRWADKDPWAVTPEANGGFGCSWCVHYGTLLYFDPKEAELAYKQEQEGITSFMERLKAKS